MSRPAHHREAGFIGVGTVVLAALLGLLAYLLLAAFEGDPDKFGRVPVPSTGAAVELPEGGSAAYYALPADPAGDAPVSPPTGFDFTIVDADGLAVESDLRGGEEKEVGEGVGRLVGIVYAPEDATYGVTASGDEPAPPGAELTFGQSPLQAIETRFEEIVDELNGPTGIVAAVVLAILLLLPTVQRAWRRRS